MRLRREESFLLVIDVQQKLAPHVEHQERIIGRCAALIRAARKLQVPVLISEHCPERIGPTVPALRGHAANGEVLRKTHFGCTDEPAFLAAITALGRGQAVVAGMEAHACVMQSALGLAERDFPTFLVADAIGSRREEDRATALERLRGAGCGVVTAEMVIFEWAGRADIPLFRELLGIVKELKEPQ